MHLLLAFVLFVVATDFPEFIVTNDFNRGSLELMAGDTVVELGTDSEGMDKKSPGVNSCKVIVLYCDCTMKWLTVSQQLE